MTNLIYPCLWMDHQAKEAATFYCSLFHETTLISESPLAVQFELDGFKLMALNGGPIFTINPSISFFVTCTTEEEIELLWGRLSDGGEVMMPLGSYPWSEKYGWTADRFGMTWQLMLGELPPGSQKIMPLFLFVGEQFGKAEEAINLYSSFFKGSSINHLELYQEGEIPGAAGRVKFGSFSLDGQQFAAMDGPGTHEFKFNEGVSLVVECDTQEEIDYFWDNLTKDGGAEVQCGWLRDKFGVSWQIIPQALGSILSNPEKSERVMQELLKMKKLDLNSLLKA